jgi:hypothetical protein
LDLGRIILYLVNMLEWMYWVLYCYLPSLAVPNSLIIALFLDLISTTQFLFQIIKDTCTETFIDIRYFYIATMGVLVIRLLIMKVGIVVSLTGIVTELSGYECLFWVEWQILALMWTGSSDSTMQISLLLKRRIHS